MQAAQSRQISARRMTILLLLTADDQSGKAAQPVLGTTRMQKLVFLVSESVKDAIKDSTYFRVDFNYEAEKFGPADLDLYQDLDFLKSMRLIVWDTNQPLELSEVPQLDSILDPAGKKTPSLLPEEREEEGLSFEYLMGFDPEEFLVADAENQGEHQYCITDRGLELLRRIFSDAKGREGEHLEMLRQACSDVRRRFGNLPLKRLLKYVYDNYQELTIKSTILDRVQGAR